MDIARFGFVRAGDARAGAVGVGFPYAHVYFHIHDDYVDDGCFDDVDDCCGGGSSGGSSECEGVVGCGVGFVTVGASCFGWGFAD